MSSGPPNPPNPSEEQPDSNLDTRPALDDDEEVLLANFDRYIDSQVPLNPTRPQSGPEQASTASPRQDQSSQSQPDGPPAAAPDPNVVEILKLQFPEYDRDSLGAILVSVGNDVCAARALIDGDTGPSTTSDEQLARRLQRREQRRHRRNGAALLLEKPVMDDVISTLREIVVPSLRAHFQELVLPDTRDDSASLVYTLQQLQVIALTLPSDNVSITPAANRSAIHVNVLNCHLELEVGRWSYENKGLVPVKDSGRASVSVHGLNIALRLEPRWSQAGGTRIVIVECNVTVDGVVRFKTQGAAADWAYNAIAVVLKPLVVSYIKEAVADTVTHALVVHLRQWAFARSLDATDTPSTHATNASSEPVTAAE